MTSRRSSKVTIKDIAKMCKVSTQTVSRVTTLQTELVTPGSTPSV